jgi:hypothetical protein
MGRSQIRNSKTSRLQIRDLKRIQGPGAHPPGGDWRFQIQNFKGADCRSDIWTVFRDDTRTRPAGIGDSRFKISNREIADSRDARRAVTSD